MWRPRWMWGIRTPFPTSPPRRKTQVSCVSVAPWVAHNAFDKLKFLARGTSSPIPYHLANEQKKTRFWQSRSSHSLLCCWLWCMCVGGGGVGWGGSTQGMGSKLVGGCGTPVGGFDFSPCLVHVQSEGREETHQSSCQA